ncbi:MAG: cytochrome ubiquinol oxidase subunit I [Actinomycetota bacterium]
MEVLDIARWQFGITTVYHFLMVPLTIGLSVLVAWYHTKWYRTRDEAYLRLTKFFGKMFLINFAVGVATGIVQEFQFGMAWSDYSRFVGDVFGAPLAMEALVAFFLESTFLGLWIFGWGRLPEKLHLATIWAVAAGTWLSGYFIIAANSWMQHPVGAIYNAQTGRAEMVDIWAVLTNNTTLAAYPHVISGSLITAAIFVAGISLWYLLTRNPSETDYRGFRWAMKSALWVTLAASVIVVASGDFQAKIMFEQQPMKMASAEALCDTETGAGFSLFAVGDVSEECNVRSFTVPGLTSYLATGDWNGEVQGVLDLNDQYQDTYGPGDYRPNLIVTYWSFRGMMGFGFVAMGAALLGLVLMRKGRIPRFPFASKFALAVIVTPFLANTAGWIFTEMGRQPWVVAPSPDGVFELRLLTENAVSTIPAGWVVISLVGFTLIYAGLAVVELMLLRRYASAGPDAVMPPPPADGDDDADRLTFAY